jgi:nuclease S1
MRRVLKSAARVCPQDQCVIGQIERFRRVLAKADTDVRKRQKALKYLIHLVGDLHQPLHAGNNADHGGNDVQVEFIGETIDPYSHKPWNLHAVWDSGILEVRDPDVHHYAERLNAWLSTQAEGAFWTSPNLVDTVLVYGRLPFKLHRAEIP